ncbi:MAG: nicotinate phosphoribosyltransferase [Firmicutes bacterium]|jgi:nicotinate phosphoribosyltransferase|nr:nicotinate phosphoribosyltransferase [Bacillota bacterium]
MSSYPRVSNLTDARQFSVEPDRPLFSATHEEILRGYTTDIYFVKTMQLLESMGLAGTRVTAEIFPRRAGMLAGLPECIGLLRGLDVEVWAVPEGESFDYKDTVLRIIGRYSDFGIFETALLGILASSSAWATAARDIRLAAGDKPFVCFGARHVHPAVAPVMERAAVVGGASSASCILGAKLAGLEPRGTVPHAVFIIAGDTVRAAKAYDLEMPADEPRIILVDTFKDEAEEALRVAEALGDRLYGIRLDTPGERGGVTPELVHEVRKRLDMAGFSHVRIFVSGGLTPERILDLSAAGADSFGVGSYISGARPIDMTMDLKEVEGRPIAKRGRIPGRLENPKLVRVL